MLRVFTVLVITAFASASAQRDSVDVRKVVEEVAYAFDANDPALLDRLTTADYTFVAPNGAIQTKEQRLAPMRSGLLHYSAARYEEIAVHMHGTTAVATARVVTRATMGEKDASGLFRATLVFALLDGEWKMVASQASAIGP